MSSLAFSSKRVAILGDIMLDRYMVGKSTRQSPEAEVPVLVNYTVEDRLGGAANVALNILGLGAIPLLFGTVGNDDSGKIFRKILREQSINDDFIVTDDKRKTTLKTRVMKGSEHLLRVDQEDLHDLDSDIEEFVLNKLRSSSIDYVILQDYNKGFLTSSLVTRVIKWCTLNDISVSIDPKFKQISSFKNCTLFKPNQKEVEDALGYPLHSLEDLHKANKDLRSLLNPQLICITLGSKGLFLSNKEDTYLSTALPLETVDVCGAGDGVISFLTLFWDKNKDLEEVGKLANVVGRIVCSKPGVAPVYLDELKSHLEDS